MSQRIASVCLTHAFSDEDKSKCPNAKHSKYIVDCIEMHCGLHWNTLWITLKCIVVATYEILALCAQPTDRSPSRIALHCSVNLLTPCQSELQDRSLPNTSNHGLPPFLSCLLIGYADVLLSHWSVLARVTSLHIPTPWSDKLLQRLLFPFVSL